MQLQMKIFCSIKLNAYQKDYLRQNIENQNILFQDEMADPLHAFLESEICFGNVDRFWVEQSEKLKWLQLESVGFEAYSNLNKDLTITNLKGFFSVPVSESVIAGILSIYRGMDKLICLKEQKKWIGASLRPHLRTLNGRKVLILGAGAIGTQIHKLLLAFNCEVKLFDKYNPIAHYAEKETLYADIQLFDIIIGCLPETIDTVHFLDRKMLDKIKKHAVIVNAGRGSLIEEGALVQKLNEGHILGAILDVTNREPLPLDDILWDTPQIILSQHTAGGFNKEIIEKTEVFLANYKRFIKGEKLRNSI